MGWRNIVLATFLLLFSAPNMTEAPAPKKRVVIFTQPMEIVVDRGFKPLGEHPMDRFLSAIAMAESSGCIQTDHRLIESGMHAGTSAIGCYGLMPITVKDIARWSKNKYLQALKDLEPAQISKILDEDQGMAHEAAREYARRLYFRFDGDHKKMAYAWLYGPGTVASSFNENHKYVRKVAKYHGRRAGSNI